MGGTLVRAPVLAPSGRGIADGGAFWDVVVETVGVVDVDVFVVVADGAVVAAVAFGDGPPPGGGSSDHSSIV